MFATFGVGVALGSWLWAPLAGVAFLVLGTIDALVIDAWNQWDYGVVLAIIALIVGGLGAAVGKLLRRFLPGRNS